MPASPDRPDPELPSPEEVGAAIPGPPPIDPDAPFLVFGLQLVVRMRPAEEVSVEVQCPQGHPIQYGTVVAVGDGFDPQANRFRAMPPVGSTVAFEETVEGVEGHYFFFGDDEMRVLHVEVITIAFPPEPPPA